jgi:hypothetical protein
MKKSLLLAALLLPCAAQAETWVCSPPASSKVTQSFYTLVREDDSFSVTYITPAASTGTVAMSRVYSGLEILMDTNAVLILQKLDEEDADVSVYIVNKLTDSFIEQTVSMTREYGRAEGSCLKM